MRSANLAISKKRHINISVRHVAESPFFLIPTIYWLPRHDVNLEIEGVSFGFCFLQMVAQVNIRQNAWRKKSSGMDLVRSNHLASVMRDELPNAPDALAIMKSFERNRWLKELSSRGVEASHYGLRVVRDAAKDEMARRDAQPKPRVDGKNPLASGNFDLKIDGLE